MIFENLLINLIFIIFPLLIYLLLVCYDNLISTKLKEIFLEIALFLSLYLGFRFGTVEIDSKSLLFFNIPIIVALLKKKDLLALFLSVIIVLYSNIVLNYNVLFLLIKIIIYFVVYYIFKYKKINDDNLFIGIIASIQGFFLAFEYFSLILPSSSFLTILEIFTTILIFYISSFFILFVFKTIDKVDALYDNLNELENEIKIKESLFKITHEIKNPIAVCKGYLDMLDLDNKEKVYKYIPIVKGEINRTLMLMNDFLELGKIKVNLEVLDVNLMLKENIENLIYFAKSNSIKLKYTIDDDELYILGDYDRIKQVILNIIKNSVEAIKEKSDVKGLISIETRIDNDNFYIEISDNGIGIEEKVLEQINMPFFSTKKKGCGLGLALSNEIIKAHNAKMEFVSTYMEYTKVILSFPLYLI